MPTVYGANASPFVRKVRVALAEKGIPYELDPVFPGPGITPEFRQMSPLGKIPAYRDGERTLADSSVIIACNAAPARCSVAAMVASRSPVAVSTSMASFSSRRSRWARSRRRAIQPCAAGQ